MLDVRDPLTGAASVWAGGRSGRVALGSAEAFLSQPSELSAGDITDPPPPPEPLPSLLSASSPLLAAPFVPAELCPALPPICEGGSSPSVTSLSRFLGIGVCSSPGEANTLPLRPSQTILPVTGTPHATHKHFRSRCYQPYCHTAIQPFTISKTSLHLRAGARWTLPFTLTPGDPGPAPAAPDKACWASAETLGGGFQSFSFPSGLRWERSEVRAGLGMFKRTVCSCPSVAPPLQARGFPELHTSGRRLLSQLDV